MEYQCQIVSVSKMVATPLGFINSLCDDCKTIDCTNPIEKKRISIIGTIKEMKLFCRGDSNYFVVSCKGFSR